MPIMVVVTEPEEAVPLIRWGYRFAQARDGKLVALYAHDEKKEQAQDIPVDQPYDGDDLVVKAMVRIAISELKAHPPEAPAKNNDGKKNEGKKPEGKKTPGQDIEIRSVAHPRILQAVLREITRVGPSLLVVAKHEPGKDDGGKYDLVQSLFEQANCDTLLLRPGKNQGRRCERVLIPAAGGPHSMVALKLGEQLTQRVGARMTALRVEPDMGDDARAVGRKIIRKTMDDAGIEPSNKIRPKVKLANHVIDGIADEVKEAALGRDPADGKGEPGDSNTFEPAPYDLVLVGSSNMGYMRRVLFGTVPESLLKGDDPCAVAVMRRARPFFAKARDAVERFFDLTIPQLERAERIDLFERLEEGSRWGFDFMALIGLSSAIAALGLIQDSAAVVIGAMLVAPLMTPLIGAGLSLVQGNRLLARESARAICYGFLTALALTFFVGLVTPIPALTSEMLARGGPNILDLAIAFLSGVAAAFAMGRPNLLAALPGVAIAAALVPPIATVGISLSLGETGNAAGSVMLFATNVVAIILGASFALYAGGIRGNRSTGKRQLWVERALMALLLACAILAVPLGSYLLSSVAQREAAVFHLPVDLHNELDEAIKEVTGGHLVKAVPVRHSEALELRLVIGTPVPLPEGLVRDLEWMASKELKVPIHIEVMTQWIEPAPFKNEESEEIAPDVPETNDVPNGENGAPR